MEDITLIEYKPINKGALLGRTTVELDNGLIIADCSVFEKDGKRWVTLPSELQRDFKTGQPLKDNVGKPIYKYPVKWKDRKLQNEFSAAVVVLIDDPSVAVKDDSLPF